MDFVRGRVTDAEGQPVAGASVYMEKAGERSSRTSDAGTDLPPFVFSGPAGEYAFTSTARNQLGPRDDDVVLRAFEGDRVSQDLVITRSRPGTVPDLVLEAGIVLRLAVHWDDGSPVEAARLTVYLTPDGARDDDVSAVIALDGETDASGEWSYGPLQDRLWARAHIRAEHPDTGPTDFRAKQCRIEPETEVITLQRGRSVSGELRTADGEPAAGYRVAPYFEYAGDPRIHRLVEADENGAFTVRGVIGRVAVYDAIPSTPCDDPQEAIRRLMAGISPSGPLLIHDVDGDDAGVLVVPKTGTLALRLQTPDGDAVTGTVFWHRVNDHHGGRGYSTEADGAIRMRGIPLGIAVQLWINVGSVTDGELEQRTIVDEVREETRTIVVNGAGTVIVRLYPAGERDQPLEAEHCRAYFDG